MKADRRETVKMAVEAERPNLMELEKRVQYEFLTVRMTKSIGNLTISFKLSQVLSKLVLCAADEISYKSINLDTHGFLLQTCVPQMRCRVVVVAIWVNQRFHVK